jgi:hypothetical protein
MRSRTLAKSGIGILTAVVSVAGVVLSAGSASANSCSVTSPWGHRGKYMCGTDLYAGKADWDHDGRVDEMFVIAPNRTIWHDWKNSGGWKVTPGNGRADNVDGTRADAYQRCVWVYVRSGQTHWKNCFYSGTWHNWAYDPG